ncbi:hypothetical protein D9M69_705420 [compost metagenome]
MMRRISRLSTPLTIFGTPRCFSPKTSRMTASRKKAMPAASSIVDSSRFDRRTTGAKRNFSMAAPMIARTNAEAKRPTMKGRPSCTTTV